MKHLTRPLAGLCLAALAAFGSPAAADTIKLRVSSYAPAGNFVNEQVIKGFLDRVVADAEGTLDYQLFPGGTLGRNPAEQLKLVQDGIADIAFVVPGFTPGAYDRYGIVEIPGLIHDAREGAAVLAAAHAAGLLETPERTRVLGVFSSDMNAIHLRDPVAGLDGLTGKSLRAVGKPQADGVTILGGVPVTGLASTEVAEAISRGTVDGAVMGAASLDAFRASEVAVQHIRVPMGSAALMLPMNLGTWEKLPAPARAAFEKHGGMAFAEATGAIFHEQDETYFAKITAKPGHSELALDDAARAAYLEKVAAVGRDWAAQGAERKAVYDFAIKTLESLRGE